MSAGTHRQVGDVGVGRGETGVVSDATHDVCLGRDGLMAGLA
jgi:hypothetical protein